MRFQRSALISVLPVAALLGGACGGLTSTITAATTPTQRPSILVPNRFGTRPVVTSTPNGVCVSIGGLSAAPADGDVKTCGPLPDWDQASDPIIMGEYRPLTQGYAQLAFSTVPDVTSLRITQPGGQVTTIPMNPATAEPMNVAMLTLKAQHVAGIRLDGESAHGSFHCDIDDQTDNIMNCTSSPQPPPTD